MSEHEPAAASPDEAQAVRETYEKLREQISRGKLKPWRALQANGTPCHV